VRVVCVCVRAWVCVFVCVYGPFEFGVGNRSNNGLRSLWTKSVEALGLGRVCYELGATRLVTDLCFCLGSIWILVWFVILFWVEIGTDYYKRGGSRSSLATFLDVGA
jgi:hypothetical protein